VSVNPCNILDPLCRSMLPKSIVDVVHVCGCDVQADDKFEDYEPRTAFFFPGQGAQTVGMAKVRPPTVYLFCHDQPSKHANGAGHPMHCCTFRPTNQGFVGPVCCG
jgi:hypothetical protein